VTLQLIEALQVIRGLRGLHHKAHFGIDAGFDDIGPQFRQQMLQQRNQRAESVYVADMREAADFDFQPDVSEVVRRIVEDPDVTLSRRARNRVLVRYDGGTLTVGELQTFMQSQLPEGRARLAQAPDSILVDNVLTGLTQRELLVERAREEGFEPREAYVDSLTQAVRTQLGEAAEVLGLRSIEPEGTESAEQAIDRTVEALLRRIVSGQQDVIPLGMVATGLREQASAQVFDNAALAVVQGVARVRGPSAPPPGTPGQVETEPGAPGGGPAPGEGAGEGAPAGGG